MRHHAKFRADWSNRSQIWPFDDFFKMVAVRHLGFLKVGNFNCRYGREGHCASSRQILCRSVKPFRRFFKMAAVRYLVLLKVRNCNCLAALEGQCASSCQLSCRSVQPFRKYEHFLIFQIRVRPPSWIFKSWELYLLDAVWRDNTRHRAKYRANRSKFKPWRTYDRFSNFQDGGRPLSWIFKNPIRRVSVSHHAKFYVDRPNLCGDMADFRLFKTAAVHHFGFVLRVFGPRMKVLRGLCDCANFG